MSTEHNSNQFLTLPFVESQKSLPKDKHAEQILRIIKQSNRNMILALVPIKDDIILDGTKFFPDAQDAAMLFFDSEYERLILKLTDESKVTFTKYKEARDLLVAAIRAQPSESKRAKVATASCAFNSSLLASIPGQTDKDQNLLST